jgi:hypothetical protein
MTKPVDLESLEALRVEADVREPWREEHPKATSTWVMDAVGMDMFANAGPEDRRYIVALVNSFPAMAAELRRLRAVVAAAREAEAFLAPLRADAPDSLSRLHDTLRSALAALSETP